MATLPISDFNIRQKLLKKCHQENLSGFQKNLKAKPTKYLKTSAPTASADKIFQFLFFFCGGGLTNHLSET